MKTIREACALYLATKCRNCNTRAAVEPHISAICHSLGDRHPASLTLPVVAASMSARGFVSTRVNRRRRLEVLAEVLRGAGVDCAHLSLEAVTEYLTSAGTPHRGTLSVADLAKLQQSMEPYDFAIVNLMLLTGLWPAVLFDLTRSDVSLTGAPRLCACGFIVPLSSAAAAIVGDLVQATSGKYLLNPQGLGIWKSRITVRGEWIKRRYAPAARQAGFPLGANLKDLRSLFCEEVQRVVFPAVDSSVARVNSVAANRRGRAVSLDTKPLSSLEFPVMTNDEARRIADKLLQHRLLLPQ